jgi:hypothetical protein
MAMTQIRSSQFDSSVDDGVKVLTAEISELELPGFPVQFQLITSAGLKVMFEIVDTTRNEGDIVMVTYKPMSPAFGSIRVIIFND